jgi:hypothetical protein
MLQRRWDEAAPSPGKVPLVTPLSLIAVTPCDPFVPSFGGPRNMAPTAKHRQMAGWGCFAVCLLGMASRGWAAAPLLFKQAAYESPVRGDPDDLLLIAGYGFAADDLVVYQAVGGGNQRLPHPSVVPTQSTAALGTADVVSAANVPHSLTVRLPKEMHAGQNYALWVRTANQEWSEAVRINDARPQWLSPSYVYSTSRVASQPRYLKIVGRNLEPADGSVTEVRLSGVANLVVKAESATVDSTALNHYVAAVKLPSKLPPGTYHVEVRRDDAGWVELAGQTLEVRRDPAEAREFRVSGAEYGGCRADDTLDDTPCVLRAAAAAAAVGGGTVVFGPGTWHLSERSMTQPDGIVIPRGVNLRGAGKLATIVVQDADGKPLPAKTTFTLLGRNVVQGFTFRDAHVYTTGNLTSSFLKLGLKRGEDAAATSSVPAAIEDVVITENIFDRPHVAISNGGAPIRNLFVTYNEFGAYRIGIELAANGALVNEKFNIEDSVIAYNLFKPGSYLAVDIGQGTMASELGASRRVDFSNNTADGTATDRLYSDDPARGWRAAFFWHMDNNNEMLLVSQNVATCTGDRDGDGEAISYDNNHNTFALARPATVVGADMDSVTITGPLSARQNERSIVIDDYYAGHWVQVLEGPGQGQVRKIRSYRENAADGAVRLNIAPAWDVIPAPNKTRIGVGREYWQVYTVANTVDHRRPLCLKSNRTKPKGGGISMWAQTADSAIEGNRQFDTDGIVFREHYNAEEPSCVVCDRATSYVDFFEIRGNNIDGEYDWNDDCSSSGIFGSIAAGPTVHTPPPTLSIGLSISHNAINHADSRRAGAISLASTWFAGPPPHRWDLVESAIIHHNNLTGFGESPARACGADKPHARTSISLETAALVRHTVLYANSCPLARRPFDLAQHDVVRVCAPYASPSCECPP